MSQLRTQRRMIGGLRNGNGGRPAALAIWGSGGHAAVVRDAAETSGRFRVVAFLDDVSVEDRHLDGVPVLTGPDPLDRIAQLQVSFLHVAVGDCSTRERLSAHAMAAGFQLATVVHPAAIIARSSEIAAGSAILAGAIVNPHARIGEGAIVNTAAAIDHHCEIGNYAHLAPGSRFGGHTSVGERTWVGIGATLIDRIEVGRDCLIGAGAVMIRNIPHNSVACGVPARLVRRLKEHS